MVASSLLPLKICLSKQTQNLIDNIEKVILKFNSDASRFINYYKCMIINLYVRNISNLEQLLIFNV